MKNLLRGIWESKATTVAGALVAAGTFLLSYEGVDLPVWGAMALGALVAFLSFYRKEGA